MQKKTDRGFVLAETLIVTTFVSGVLIFLFIQFTKLSENYSQSYSYNTVDSLYATKHIRDYIVSDSTAYEAIKKRINDDLYMDITSCNVFQEREYCKMLLKLEKAKKVLITNNNFDKVIFYNYDEKFKKFINKIDGKGIEQYRIIVEFNDSTYATLRFGD